MHLQTRADKKQIVNVTCENLNRINPKVSARFANTTGEPSLRFQKNLFQRRAIQGEHTQVFRVPLKAVV